ncbi:hypothetical protein [Ruminiclostridium cellulolyticum]|uniref:Uncharacterized protein n=1 Tax=Ruminiclostridium cellulolyticum (strain ATCC 35319 / DSM 5812 / JCM 6584 / H10) TaxID=394503 RepID=B8I890_RUMCH|nr:hypothetical protein [Ruminiclostridium cellulolyticum]ACL77190.1 conserved hypothetical protein [Ruminiclostridium cellulolyticum H10]
MSEEFEFERGTTKAACSPVVNWEALLAKYIGQTVTIFTSSGGDSGSGFTGVLMTVNSVFVRLLTRIGPPPGCSLGNSCTNFSVDGGKGYGGGYGSGNCCGSGFGGYGVGMSGSGPIVPANVNGAVTAGGWDSIPVYTVGSVTDIPIPSIVSFVHNAV